MGLFSEIYNSAVGLFLPRKTTKELGTKKRSRSRDSYHKDSQRRPDDNADQIITKRRRVDKDHYAPIVNGETYEIANVTSSNAYEEYQQRDRTMMPPPRSVARPRPVQTPTKQTRTAFDPDAESSQISLTSMTTRQKLTNDEYDMERARRQAAATTLPEHSGVWERGEKELFYHLAYRGFEALLPQNWMVDFRTMPVTLFNCEEDLKPLIRPHTTTEFRAIRELRELLDLGKNLRDKVLASPGARSEIIIEKAITKYLSWALADANIVLPSQPTIDNNCSALPIHVIVKMKPGQDTASCILEISSKLHALALRHRQAKGLYPSVENELSHRPEEKQKTRVADSHEDDLPVLYGFMVCRSIVAVFTMNSTTPIPQRLRERIFTPTEENDHSPVYNSSNYSVSTDSRFERRMVAKWVKQQQQQRKHLGHETDEEEQESVSSPRFIADFDFSDSAKDVWNSFALAICVMQIRRDMLIYMNGSDEVIERHKDVATSVNDEAVAKEHDPDM